MVKFIRCISRTGREACPTMKILVPILLLVVAAQATTVNTYTYTSTFDFGNKWTPVTDDSTPDWAKLPNAQQWWEMETGITMNNAHGVLLILRALRYFG